MRNNSIFLGIILLFSFYYKAVGQNDLTDRLDKYLQAKTDYFNFSGAVLVSRNDSIILKKGMDLPTGNGVQRTLLTQNFVLLPTQNNLRLLLFSNWKNKAN